MLLSKSVCNFIKMGTEKTPLKFTVLAECSTTKARTSKMVLPHHEVDTPVFMPVGTQVCTRYLESFETGLTNCLL